MKTETKVELVLAYALTIVGGLIIYFIERKNQFLRFHAMQSILLGAVICVPSLIFFLLSWIPVLGWLFKVIQSLLGLAWLVLTVVCIIKSWNGDFYKLPVIGDKAEEFAR